MSLAARRDGWALLRLLHPPHQWAVFIDALMAQRADYMAFVEDALHTSEAAAADATTAALRPDSG